MKNYLSLIKFSHTIFAMPFALVGVALGYKDSRPDAYVQLLVMVVLCMIFARSAAMAFNRWLDRDIDAINPRTAIRDIPSGTVRAKSAMIFVIINCLLFIFCTFFINTICFILSPVALLVILGYSYTKKFTSLCHLVLGVGLALAPVGAYLAMTGHFGSAAVLIGVSVMFWVAGFDVIYALQDRDFDKANDLNSIPVVFGTTKALRISELFHVLAGVVMTGAMFYIHSQFPLSWISVMALILFLSLLLYQHLIIKPNDLSRVNMAFFTTNGIASVVFGALLITDLLL
ncbi:MAG: UbiA family prenyltransferase [Saprospiraceae bacterium]|nr:UbiA family prenyltransferase [Saprospiraceae bacterium]